MSELQNNNNNIINLCDDDDDDFEIPFELPEAGVSPITPLSTYSTYFRNPSPPIAPRKRNKRKRRLDFTIQDEPNQTVIRNVRPRNRRSTATSTVTQNLLNIPHTPTTTINVDDQQDDHVRRILTYGNVVNTNERQISLNDDINNIERSIRERSIRERTISLHFNNFSNALSRLTRSPPPSPSLSFSPSPSPSPSPTPERSSLYDDFHAYDEPRFVEEALSVSISPPPPPPTPAKEIKDAIIPPSIANITCKICMENETCILIEPCYHACLCFPCSIHIGDKCPICRGVISKRRRIYFS